MKKNLFIAMAILFTYTINAQDTEKRYNFAYTISDSCNDSKVVYFSPIVSCTVPHLWFDNEESQLKRKWQKKVFANYKLKTYCFYKEAWVWKSYGKVDEQRDKTIAEFRNRGYKVYANYTFGFHYVSAYEESKN
ncbi:hypothetical protein A9Q86_09910 [Flavobacteriales bacterium 33_180_T64]|nr:hypothetical protein A9Q86_09910 [Flavobacteriales bacterium 33_180_T64]